MKCQITSKCPTTSSDSVVDVSLTCDADSWYINVDISHDCLLIREYQYQQNLTEPRFCSRQHGEVDRLDVRPSAERFVRRVSRRRDADPDGAPILGVRALLSRRPFHRRRPRRRPRGALAVRLGPGGVRARRSRASRAHGRPPSPRPRRLLQDTLVALRSQARLTRRPREARVTAAPIASRPDRDVPSAPEKRLVPKVVSPRALATRTRVVHE